MGGVTTGGGVPSVADGVEVGLEVGGVSLAEDDGEGETLVGDGLGVGEDGIEALADGVEGELGVGVIDGVTSGVQVGVGLG